MSYLVFARKYRPETFKDVLGQDHVIRTLSNAIAQERLAHAYLFVGPRGTGKTTTARIFAKALNCTDGPSIDFNPEEEICQEIAEGRSLDVIEIDGASNNGVEEVRNLRETVKYSPAKCRYKIIYIDEVHMLSSAAFNALLKTLEEPPPHVKFIFATTEAHKILPTIISRCQRFDLRPIPTEIIVQQLQTIASEEGISLAEEAAWTISKGADGGMRDALSMLDQLVAFCGDEITPENVREIFGFTSGETVHTILSAILKKESVPALQAIQQQHSLGKDLSQLLKELIQVTRALLIEKVQPGTSSPGLPDALWQELKALSEPHKADRLLATLDQMADSEAKLRWSSDKALHLEIAIIKVIQSLGEVSLNDLISTLGRLPSDTPLGGQAAPITEAEPKASSPALAAPPAAQVTAAPDPVEEKAPEEPAPVEPAPSPTPPVMETPAPPSEPEQPASAPPEAQTEPTPPQADPLPENPLQATTDAPRPTRPKRSSAGGSDINARLDSLMANAVDELPPEEPPAAKPKPEVKEPTPPKATSEEEQKKAQEDFHNDPLIQEALKKFEGTLIQ